jgi:hypothetical protein
VLRGKRTRNVGLQRFDLSAVKIIRKVLLPVTICSGKCLAVGPGNMLFLVVDLNFSLFQEGGDRLRKEERKENRKEPVRFRAGFERGARSSEKCLASLHDFSKCPVGPGIFCFFLLLESDDKRCLCFQEEEER